MWNINNNKKTQNRGKVSEYENLEFKIEREFLCVENSR